MACWMLETPILALLVLFFRFPELLNLFSVRYGTVQARPAPKLLRFSAESALYGPAASPSERRAQFYCLGRSRLGGRTATASQRQRRTCSLPALGQRLPWRPERTKHGAQPIFGSCEATRDQELCSAALRGSCRWSPAGSAAACCARTSGGCLRAGHQGACTFCY